MNWTVGQGVLLASTIENFPTVIVPAGERGTIASINDEAIMVRLDSHYPQLAEWDNELEIWREWNESELRPWASDADIAAAAAMADLNAACAHLQRIIGQTDGGIAGEFFSGFDDADGDWQKSTPEQRAHWMIEYLQVEAAHIRAERADQIAAAREVQS